MAQTLMPGGPALYAVLSVTGPADAPGRIDADAPARWYDRVSGGQFRPAALDAGSVRLDHALGRYRGPRPGAPDSRHLVEAVVARLDDRAASAIAAADGHLVLVLPGPVRPHAWRPRRGTRAATLIRGFAVLPPHAPLGAVAHELGHLLLGWPDGERGAHGADHCLMALGALHPQPAWPAAPLRLARGWAHGVPLHPRTPAGALSTSTLGLWGAPGTRTVIERRGDTLLAWTDTPRPRLVGRTPLAAGDAPVLGLLGPALRRAQAPA